MQFFIGKGYDEKFVNNMNEVINELKKEDDVRIVFSNDDICNCCPKFVNGECQDIEKVSKYDSHLMSRLHLAEGIFSYAMLKNLVFAEIIRPNKRCEICADCEWNSICQTSTKAYGDSL